MVDTNLTRQMMTLVCPKCDAEVAFPAYSTAWYPCSNPNCDQAFRIKVEIEMATVEKEKKE